MNDPYLDLVKHIDGTGSDVEYGVINELRKKLGNRLPSLLFEKYKSSKQWKIRRSCVYHSIRYARESDDAVRLGIVAIEDKSKVVRYRACMLLAYALKKETIFSLKQAEKKFLDKESLDNFSAAIDAIENQNSNFFVDRGHSGRIFFSSN